MMMKTDRTALFALVTQFLQLPRLAMSGCPTFCTRPLSHRSVRRARHLVQRASIGDSESGTIESKGKLLVLGGTGFLGQAVCHEALNQGYDVTSLSRRGLPPLSDENRESLDLIDYRQGDARIVESVSNILNEGGYIGVVHCIGLLLDDASGLGDFNRYVSGSGSLPDPKSTYDTITRQTAFNAIEVTSDYAMDMGMKEPVPFCFTSAAEAGWPDVPGGAFMESLAPDFLKRYLVAKRTVEAKLLGSKPLLRPIIVRPSLIYTMEKPESYLPVGAFFLANRVGLPFVDRPVTVQSLALAIILAIARNNVTGILRYQEIDRLSETSASK